MKNTTAVLLPLLKKTISLFGTLFLCLALHAQVGIIHTIAGGVGSGIPATAASIDWPQQSAIDASGNIYFADAGNSRIRKIDASTGIITTVAGNGLAYYTADNIQATASGVNNPYGVAVDASGNIYIAETSSNRIRKVDASTGIITTLAGMGSSGNSGDGGPATAALLNHPYNIALDDTGNIYFSDAANYEIRKIRVSTGIINTVVGNGTYVYNGDGIAATTAQISATGITLAASGDIYFTDPSNSRIRMVTASTGIISTIAGNGTGGFKGDGTAAISAEVSSPYGIAVDDSGNVYFADQNNNRIRKIAALTGVINTIAGDGGTTYNGDSIAPTTANLNSPSAVSVDAGYNLYISDQSNNRIQKIKASTNIIRTITGGYVGVYGAGFYGDGGPATLCGFNSPYRIALDTARNIYIVDDGNNRIRVINSSSGIINTIAGNGKVGFNGDGGPATAAELNQPYDVALDIHGNIFIDDEENNRIREVFSSSAEIVTVAGNYKGAGYTGDGGNADSAELYIPLAVATDRKGNFYIADGNNQVVRKVDKAGIITTIAGNGTHGYTGDGGQATAAELYEPQGLAVDTSGDIYIVDEGNYVVRKVTASTGIITTFAGVGFGNTGSLSNGIPATNATISPNGVALDGQGNLYIADGQCNGVREVNINTRVIATIAGSGSYGYSGDGGDAALAQLRNPRGVVLDADRNIYIADADNNVIRKVDVFQLISQPSSIHVCINSDTTLKVAATGSGNTYQWQVSTGSGFGNISNGGVYSGATTNSLHIKGAISTMNGYTYRCVLNGTYSRIITSDTAMLNIAAPIITITAVPIGALCSGDSLRLSGNNAVSYSWNNGVIDSSAFIPSSSGKYIVIGIDRYGCTGKDSISVVVNPTPTVSISGASYICHGKDILTASASGSFPFNYIWSTTGTNDTLIVTNSNTYSVTVVDSKGCKSETSINVTKDAVPGPSICMVSVDSTSTKNLIVWDKPVQGAIDSFKIYREIASAFVHIASLPYHAYSVYTDTTNGVNPNTTSYQYKISAVDTCGNESVLSTFHKTIHVSIGPASPCGYNLNWNDYIGFPIAQYLILRDSAGTGWKVKDSVSFGNTSWTDGTCYSAGVLISYQVKAVNPSPCSPSARPFSGNLASTVSNQQNNNVTGINEINASLNVVTVYPNPTKDILNIKFSHLQAKDANINVTDVTGRLVMVTTKNINPNEVLSLNTSDLPSGVYFIKVVAATFVQQVRFIKN